MEVEEQDLAGVDLEHLEHAYRHQKLYTIPRDQLRKVHKVFLNSSAGSSARASKALGIQGSQTKNPNKAQKDEKKRGRKSTNKLIQEIGSFMVNSGQIHLISDSFPPLPPPPSIIMKIISWNIRGLNGRSKQKLLRDLIIEEAPDVVMLQETKCTSEDINRLLPYYWKQGGVVSIDAAGTTGGLSLLWNTNTVLLENFCTTRWAITADYRLIGSDKPGHLTTVYGPATPRDKQAFLRSLSYLSSLTQYHRWIVGGDFNIIRSLEEKKGGSRRLDRDSGDFNSLIDDLRLIDLEAINGIHTWSNRRTGLHQIACKLDRFLVSEPLMMDGMAIESSILNRTGSDHWPIQLWLDVPATLGKKPFRFEQFWLDHPDFQANIQGWWKEAEIPHRSKMYRFQ
jgi:exonuclease III